MSELSKLLLEMRTVLFGSDQSEPNADACEQLTREFFKEDTLRLLIASLPKLAMGFFFISYEDGDVALTYGAIARECIRHQSVARYVLESEHMKKFFSFLQIPNFDIASDAQATFKELLTRHKSTVAEFLSKNYDWFFQEYNSQLLESSSYITKRHAVKLLGDILLDRSNSAVMVKYVSSLDNMRILMNLLRLFVANQNKPPEIISVLIANRSKLLRFFSDFNIDKGR
ncbi:putative MO25-like protein [Citrus sinensis]|nr:putative MO25-like protein [Citrus sinensis]